MSNTPKPETPDPLLAALQELPTVATDGPLDARLQREARAAYVRSFQEPSWPGAAVGTFSRLAVPVFLAGIVGLYMTWAFASATALLR